ncbi:transposable element Tc1 transposase [Trichonephila clavipes]|nr:transposable element Tc1 transposase [Trichonephila clavipes]
MNVNLVEIHRKIVAVYGESVFSDRIVRKWIQQFNDGRANVDEEAQSGWLFVFHDGLVEKQHNHVCFEAVNGRGSTARKSGSGPRNVTSARDDRRLVRMAHTDCTASSRQLAPQWSTATGVSLCASSIRGRLLQRGLHTRIPLYRIPLTQNHRHLRLQWANVHRSWRADWQQVVFSDESRLNLWHHDGRIRVRPYAGERHIPNSLSNATVDEHPELWSGVP